MSLPLADGQFWVVTALAAGALWTVVRPLLRRRGRRPAGCAGCSRGTGSCAGTARGARLVALGRPR